MLATFLDEMTAYTQPTLDFEQGKNVHRTKNQVHKFNVDGHFV